MAKKNSLRKDIPEDITTNILHRLPLQSLVQFRCVSKSWLSIISDPHFSKSHFKRESEQNAVARKLLLIHNDPPYFRSLYYETLSVTRNLPNPFKQHGRSTVDVLGSCNGLLFATLYNVASYKRSFVIWNPLTGTIQKLPDPSLMQRFSANPDVLSYYGFGYVSAIEDYKALVTIDGNFELFSMRAKSWKTIEPPKLSVWGKRTPFWEEIRSAPSGRMDEIVSNEALHWLLKYVSANRYEYAILDFDLGKEEFRELSLSIPNLNMFLDLGIACGGCLCVVVITIDLQCTVWLMKEYRVRESWINKLFIIVEIDANDFDTFTLLGFGCRGDCASRPIVYDESGEIVIAWRICNKSVPVFMRFDSKLDIDPQEEYDMLIMSDEEHDKEVYCDEQPIRQVIEYDETLLNLA